MPIRMDSLKNKSLLASLNKLEIPMLLILKALRKVECKILTMMITEEANYLLRIL
jgi:hypothetical protein